MIREYTDFISTVLACILIFGLALLPVLRLIRGAAWLRRRELDDIGSGNVTLIILCACVATYFMIFT